VLFLLLFSSPGIRSVPEVPVLRRCPLSRLRGLSLLSLYHVGACCPGMRSVPVFLVCGRCLLSQYEVGGCGHSMRSVTVVPV